MARKQSEIRYIITDVASVPVCRMASKREAYQCATKPGWGVVEWYSAINNYSVPVNRDPEDPTQQLVCDEDTSAVLYPRYGQEFIIAPYEEINPKEIPKQAELDAIIIGDSCGYNFWASAPSDIKIFVTYDENGLIDSYRLENWAGKPYNGEAEIPFTTLQSTEDYDNIPRAEIKGTWEYDKNSRPDYYQ